VTSPEAPQDETPSRRRNAAGAPVWVHLRDPQLLITLRAARPDAKGRPGRHLSQRQAAQAIGISHGHLAEIELGHKRPSYRAATAIAEFYGVDMSALFEFIPYYDDAA
jgi:DNA-binding XRE family transcriptional regulator